MRVWSPDRTESVVHRFVFDCTVRGMFCFLLSCAYCVENDGRFSRCCCRWWMPRLSLRLQIMPTWRRHSTSRRTMRLIGTIDVILRLATHLHPMVRSFSHLSIGGLWCCEVSIDVCYLCKILNCSLLTMLTFVDSGLCSGCGEIFSLIGSSLLNISFLVQCGTFRRV